MKLRTMHAHTGTLVSSGLARPFSTLGLVARVEKMVRAHMYAQHNLVFVNHLLDAIFGGVHAHWRMAARRGVGGRRQVKRRGGREREAESEACKHPGESQ